MSVTGTSSLRVIVAAPLESEPPAIAIFAAFVVRDLP